VIATEKRSTPQSHKILSFSLIQENPHKETWHANTPVFNQYAKWCAFALAQALIWFRKQRATAGHQVEGKTSHEDLSLGSPINWFFACSFVILLVTPHPSSPSLITVCQKLCYFRTSKKSLHDKAVSNGPL
jgi:hypothetical protein